MKTVRNFFQKTGVALIVTLASSTLFAEPIATEQIFGLDITLSPTVTYDTATLRVSVREKIYKKTSQFHSSLHSYAVLPVK